MRAGGIVHPPDAKQDKIKFLVRFPYPVPSMLILGLKRMKDWEPSCLGWIRSVVRLGRPLRRGRKI